MFTQQVYIWHITFSQYFFSLYANSAFLYIDT